MLALLTGPNLHDFLNPEARQMHYSRVQTARVHTVLSKLAAHYNASYNSGASARRRGAVVRLSPDSEVVLGRQLTSFSPPFAGRSLASHLALRMLCAHLVL